MTAAVPVRVQPGAFAGEAEVATPAPVAWALCLLAFSIPLEAPDRFAFEVSAMTAGLFVISTLLAPSKCYGRLPWAVGGYGLFLLVLLIAYVTQGVAYPGGLYSGEVAKQVVRLAMWVLLFWAGSNLLQDERLYRAALWALVVGCLVRAALPLLGLARSTSVKGVERVAALGQNPNQSAQVLALGLLALIGITYVQANGARRWRPLVWGGVGLIAVGITQTGSRGGLATAALGTLVFLGSGRTLRTRIRNVVVGALVLGCLGFLALRSDAMSYRVEKAVATGDMSGREEIWPATLSMIAERPWLGWGPVTNKRELAARLNDAEHERRDTHNLVLELVTATGLLGAIPFLFATWLCIRAAWRARTGPRRTVPLALLGAMLAGNMTQNRLTFPVLWLVLAIGFAAAPRAGDPRC